jgi:hypothetical protein
LFLSNKLNCCCQLIDARNDSNHQHCSDQQMHYHNLNGLQMHQIILVYYRQNQMVYIDLYFHYDHDLKLIDLLLLDN